MMIVSNHSPDHLNELHLQSNYVPMPITIQGMGQKSGFNCDDRVLLVACSEKLGLFVAALPMHGAAKKDEQHCSFFAIRCSHCWPARMRAVVARAQ